MTQEQYDALVAEERRRVVLHARGGPPYVPAYVPVMDDPEFLRSIGVDMDKL